MVRRSPRKTKTSRIDPTCPVCGEPGLRLGEKQDPTGKPEKVIYFLWCHLCGGNAGGLGWPPGTEFPQHGQAR